MQNMCARASVCVCVCVCVCECALSRVRVLHVLVHHGAERHLQNCPRSGGQHGSNYCK
jgi:hypothetical protein